MRDAWPGQIGHAWALEAMALAKKVIVETRYGDRGKYAVVKTSDLLSTAYYIEKDGQQYSSYFSSLRDAIKASEKTSGD